MVVPTALPGVWSVACSILARRGLVWLVTLQAHVTEGTHRGRASHLVPDGAGIFLRVGWADIGQGFLPIVEAFLGSS